MALHVNQQRDQEGCVDGAPQATSHEVLRARPGVRPVRASRGSSRTVHLVATPGGHLDLLLTLRSSFEDFRRVWVVTPGTSAQALVDEGEEVRLLPRFHGLSLRSLSKSRAGLRLALRERPEFVVTAGSGCVVPFVLGAKALGAKLIYMETMARITDASSTGRLVGRFAEEVVVQWDTMLRHYPTATVCRPALLDAALENTGAPRNTGEGTFVAVGTHVDPFDRILRMVDEAVAEGLLPRPAEGQSGVSRYEPESVTLSPWLTPLEMKRRFEAARYVVCHAGSGLIARALRSNLRPMIVPRRESLGEHVDDHQLQIVEHLARYGLVVPVEADEITPEHLAMVDEPWRPIDDLATLPRLQEVVRRAALRCERAATP